MAGRIYLDWNATTPLRPEAKAAMAHAWEIGGNPSSVHAEGREARRLVEEARAAVAAAVGAEAQNVIFTSGGTEANSLALAPGLRRGKGPAVERLLVSAIEHASVLAGGRFAADAIAPHRRDARRRRRSRPVCARCSTASLRWSPSCSPTTRPARSSRSRQPPRSFTPRAACCMSMRSRRSAKFRSTSPPPGPTCCRSRRTRSAAPRASAPSCWPRAWRVCRRMLRGGGQEKGRRAGTEDVAGIAGFGAAAKAALSGREGDAEPRGGPPRAARNGSQGDAGRRHFRRRGASGYQIPFCSRFPGMRAETAVIGFDLAGIAVSSGSACSSGKVQPSHVVEAMGFGPELAQGAVRLSLGWSTTEADIEFGPAGLAKACRWLT